MVRVLCWSLIWGFIGIYYIQVEDTSDIFGLNMTTIWVMGCGLKLGFESRVM